MGKQDLRLQVGIPIEFEEQVINWSYTYFQHVVKKEYFDEILKYETNWDISILLLNEDNDIKGVYLLGDKQIDSIVNKKDYKPLKGVEGILIAVDKSFRGKGWGTKLKDYPKKLGFDYIWGQQLKTLGNIHDWLKRRILISETDTVYITLELFDMY